MHFSIPETQEFTNGANVFTGFNIYINGSFHCCLRYKQLHSLHDQLKRSLMNLSLPQFPPKKLLTLTHNELEQRRLALERYLQLIGQDPVLSKSNLLRTFLLNAQQESAFIETYGTTIDVFLMNGYSITVNVSTTESSLKVLEKSLRAIDLPEDFTYYFALFLLRKESDGKVTLVRKLMDFESPFISLRTASDCQIVIRKNYWDPNYDLDLMRDRIALNLLYIQSLSDMEMDWMIASPEVRQRLSSLQVTGNKHEYMNIIRNLPSYGCIQFSNVDCDFFEPKSKATIVIGNQELGIRTMNGKVIQETKFRVTRMRCWRVTTISSDTNNDKKIKTREKCRYTYELSFEYLMAKNCLKWIKLVTEQAMLISVCLQSMVDELLNQKNGYDINNINTTLALDQQLDYIKRDDNSIGRLSESTSDGSINSLNEMKPITKISNETAKSKIKNKVSTSVFFKNGKESVQNEAFENIGDDDL
ncbi:CLUMA_CG000078, isoform A [Clunio marinus]|uniref:CLUMA_CG000078, isoform A n=1 Tax=Clunio marinus TaxID=568069 RepID=A0A1J1HEI5_9DIPT|nr:CLUMA_CG000078, isoform A [Clunio marinus]